MKKYVKSNKVASKDLEKKLRDWVEQYLYNNFESNIAIAAASAIPEYDPEDYISSFIPGDPRVDRWENARNAYIDAMVADLLAGI